MCKLSCFIVRYAQKREFSKFKCYYQVGLEDIMKFNVIGKIEDLSEIKNIVDGENIVIVDNEQKFSIIENPTKYYYGKRLDSVYKINLNEVIYFQSVGRYNYIYTSNGIFKIDDTLKTIESRISSNFVRISKSAIVNLYYVLSIKPTYNMRFELKMKDNEDIIVTRSFQKKFRKRIGL